MSDVTEEDVSSYSVKELKRFITQEGGDVSNCIDKEDLKELAISLLRKKAKRKGQEKGMAGELGAGVRTGVGRKDKETSTIKSGSSGTQAKAGENGTKQHVGELNGELSDEEDDELDDSSDDEDEELEGEGDDDDNELLRKHSDYGAGTSASASKTSSSSKGTGTPGSASSTSSSRKRFSVFRAKKFVASKVSDTKAGRATVIKVLGEDGDVIIRALKSVAEKLDGKAVAKDKKKKTLKFLLKAYNLWKYKHLNEESLKTLQRPMQITGERFLQLCDETRPIKSPDVSPLVQDIKTLQDALIAVMSPHLQPKNTELLSSLISYYGSLRLLNALIFDERNHKARSAIEDSLRTLLLQFPSILPEMKTRDEAERVAAYYFMVKNPTIETFLDQPRLMSLVHHWMERVSSRHENSLKFVSQVRGFEKISTKKILSIRAPKIVDKFLRESSPNRVPGINQEDIEEIKAAIDSDKCSCSLFNKVRDQAYKAMENDILIEFTNSPEYQRHLSEAKAQYDAVVKQFGDIF